MVGDVRGGWLDVGRPQPERPNRYSIGQCALLYMVAERCEGVDGDSEEAEAGLCRRGLRLKLWAARVCRVSRGGNYGKGRATLTRALEVVCERVTRTGKRGDDRNLRLYRSIEGGVVGGRGRGRWPSEAMFPRAHTAQGGRLAVKPDCSARFQQLGSDDKIL